MLFSQRKGIKPVKTIIQSESMDDNLRNGLWNALSIFYWDNIFVYDGYISEDQDIRLFRILWLDYFKHPLDTMNRRWTVMYKFIRENFFESEWNEAYDFIEFLIGITGPYHIDKDAFVNYCNNILEREVSAYRIVGYIVTEITSDVELVEIEEALEKAGPLKPIYRHLKSSLNLLSDRKSPDYRNSIKESISAVESVCKKITTDEKATLGQALKKIESALKIHPALKTAFNNIYGYTSDEDGIRHSLLEESDLAFEDAKFMLVSCSAFINYLLSKSAKTGLKL